MSNFVKTLTKLMHNEKINLAELHKSTGISKTQLGKYMQSNYEPSVKSLNKICNYFNCSFDYILGLNKDDVYSFEPKDLNAEEFINRYYELLSLRNISHAEVCRKANCNRNNLVYWKKNKSFPTLEILKKYAEILNVSIDYLVGRSDDR